jgi:tRNA (uracil-5-)-methyltransferase TRM9
VVQAGERLGLSVGTEVDCQKGCKEGVQIIQDGWERSNYYVELKRWSLQKNDNST